MVKMSPLDEVRSSCENVCNLSTLVSMNDAKVEALAKRMTESLAAAKQPPAWDADGWHYCADAAEYGPITCHYIFVLDCLNFCFWPVEGLEYEQVAVGLKNAFVDRLQVFEPESLANVSEAEVKSWIGPELEWPLLSERVLRVRELGRVLLNQLEMMERKGVASTRNGLDAAANLVSEANNSAAKLVEILLSKFSGFRDTGIYKGNLVYYYKRVQILVGDLWAAYGRKSDGPMGFNDIECLTTFPDYRVPQLLRHLGCLEYNPQLAEKIDNKVELCAGGVEEAEIRAYTVVCVEKLRARIVALGNEQCVKEAQNVTAVEVDWLLWQEGEQLHLDNAISPPHHILTIFY